jgi:thiol-disulfide isomerase/thioredoxin
MTRTLLLLLFTTSASAADLRDIKQPEKILSTFPSAARVRVVNVWATWCVPCVAEMPELRAVRDAFGSEVALAGVSLDDMIPGTDRKKVVAFLDRQKIAFPNVYYTGNPDALGDFLRFDGEIPITIAFDRSGKELWRRQGPIQRASTIAELRKLLGRIP